MYLERHNYIGNKWRDKGARVTVRVPKNQDGVRFPQKLPIKNERVQYVHEEIAYWRKANAIHQFFVDNCANGEDNCKPVYVPADTLRDLHDRCTEVLKASELKEGKIKNGYTLKENGEKEWSWEKGKFIKNPIVAKKLLPTQSGFFFGNTEYDEWYLKDIEETKDMLDKLFKEDPELEGDYHYQASW